ncbi:Leucine-rich repeat-containing protein 29 [Coemansia nantahalensis]|nr:Leucine-rich repeat-containing protein 29 [Coemansia nantahalensis]
MAPTNGPDAAARAWRNDVILARLIQSLPPASLGAVSSTDRRGWAYAVPRLWSKLEPQHIKSFRLLADTVGKPPLLPIGSHRFYGSLVRVLDLGMLSGRWDKVDYQHMSAILTSCCHLHTLDMSLCLSLRSSEFEGLMAASHEMGQALANLDISETSFSVSSMCNALELLPNLKSLNLTSTQASDEVMETISKHNTSLVHLNTTDCVDVTDVGIRKVVESCRSLSELILIDCPYVEDYDYLARAGISYQWDESIDTMPRNPDNEGSSGEDDDDDDDSLGDDNSVEHDWYTTDYDSWETTDDGGSD